MLTKFHVVRTSGVLPLQVDLVSAFDTYSIIFVVLFTDTLSEYDPPLAENRCAAPSILRSDTHTPKDQPGESSVWPAGIAHTAAARLHDDAMGKYQRLPVATLGKVDW